MNTMTVFGQTAFFLRKKWISWTCLILILLVGLSRLYLGMHFISDVLGGWLFGGLIVFVFVRFGDGLVKWLLKRPIWQQAGLIILSAGLWIMLAYLPYWLNSGLPIPAEWIKNAVRLGEATQAATVFGNRYLYQRRGVDGSRAGCDLVVCPRRLRCPL